MNQTTAPNATKELKLQKSTVVKLNMAKVGQMLRNGQQAQFGTTSNSTLPECDSTMATMTIPTK